jgi:hypothetical protein
MSLFNKCANFVFQIFVNIMNDTYIAAAKNALFKSLKFLLPLIFVLGFMVPAKAQFSIMLGGVYQNFTKDPKDSTGSRIFLFGLNPRVAYDIGQKMQVSVQSNLQYYAIWKYVENIPLEGISVSTTVPKPQTQNGLGVIEFSALYTYFFKGKNYSNGGLYVSGGPGMAVYIYKLSALGSASAFRNSRTDIQFDTRLGGQYHIPIGWVYLEGRFAPTIIKGQLAEKEQDFGSLYGVNLGIRYLLNRHPYCVD